MEVDRLVGGRAEKELNLNVSLGKAENRNWGIFAGTMRERERARTTVGARCD